MATGTTSDKVIKRDELIKDSLWHVRALPPDGRVSVDLLRRTVRILNNLIRQESLKLSRENRALWALDYAGLFLVGDSHIYGVAQGLRPDAQDVVRIQLRSDGGNDDDVTIISQSTYDGLNNKNEIGDTTKVYISPGRLPQDNLWYLWPVRSGTAEVPDAVVGADNKSYECVQAHTSDDDTYPGGGQSWKLYWQLSRSDTTTAWATATAYVNGDMLYYSFKRPLYDFSSPYDSPDMPSGWESYLTYKLALQLAVGRNLSEKDILMLRSLLKQAEVDIFPSRQPTSTDWHNKGLYF